MVSYAEQSYKVAIVPVNETDIDISAIRQTLKDIYGPAGITWEVSEEKNYYYFGENKFFEKNSGLLSSYTPEMRAMNADFAPASAKALHNIRLSSIEKLPVL